ncbi:unnamed protein product, partial [Adineta steineri]
QPLLIDQVYIDRKNEVIKAERRLLKELGFCVYVKHPHKVIAMYLKILEKEREKDFVQTSWNYMNDSLRTDIFLRFPPETIACACIDLAARNLQIALPKNPPWYLIFGAKPEEIRYIMIQILRIYKHRPIQNCFFSVFQPLLIDQVYIDRKNEVIKAERRLLKELGFCVYVKHPHKVIAMYLKILEKEREKDFVQTSWNYMNDSLRTDIFLRFPPETIACACIDLAARNLQIALPKNPPWYLIFGAKPEEIRYIMIQILRIYKHRP